MTEARTSLARAVALRLRAAAQRPVSSASLAAFRFLFGLVLCIAMLRFVSRGWIDSLYLEPRLHFTYPGFGWVRPWPGIGLHLHFLVLAALALAIALGLRTRLCAALFLAGFAYVELLDQATYLNHYYLVTLIAFLLCLLPVDAAYGIDARRGAVRPIPAYVVWVLRAQLGFVYFFAGLAKLRADWLLRGEPLTTWLQTRAELPLVGPLLAMPRLGLYLSWAGAVFDLTIVGFLLWRRTRLAAYLVAAAFHVFTGLLFHIGVFPWVMIALTTIFFAPDWPLLGRRASTVTPPSPRTMHPIVPVLLALHVILQVALPMRRYLYPGDSCWSEDGYRFAWTVMLMEKTGLVDFEVVNRDGRRRTVHPRAYLTPYQVKTMAAQPEMIVAFAKLLARELGDGEPVRVYADAVASLNGRPARRLVDPSIDLASLEVSPFAPSAWVLPLDRAPVP